MKRWSLRLEFWDDAKESRVTMPIAAMGMPMAHTMLTMELIQQARDGVKELQAQTGADVQGELTLLEACENYAIRMMVRGRNA